ncbi:MAG TPA: hypothetical protein VHL11_05065 [Phototrophicaceae bacterium]|jgi:TctA family transporter|nr:hypothetical protein [Phototrophicaceae bacterium]
MFEHHSARLISRAEFARRVGRYAALAILLITISWLIGILGYRFLEGASWIDAILDAAMILSGMGPASTLHTDAGKLFVSLYAMFSGVVFLVSIGVLMAPVFHRLLHQFHLEAEDEADDEP